EESRTQDSGGGGGGGGPDDEDGEEEEEEEPAAAHSGGDEEEEGGEEEEESQWRGPGELQLSDEGAGSSRQVEAVSHLQPDTVWGPYPGAVQSKGSNSDQEAERSRKTLVCEDPDCWIRLLPLTSDPSAANCSIYSRGEELFCQVSREIPAGEKLLASLSPPPPPSSSSLSLLTQKQPAVKEEPLYPAALHSDIQLLPQQAGMAAILATAVVNKDIFPCKDCGVGLQVPLTAV
ncbi:zinc finger protein ZFPM1, partial [Austrofundulus limnaeus]|uniref:Zinc finger protein ZFPM1 n=1 Tax=Austrofundulus limnaeus TaxID=52670 RepID=A0A2I4CIW8_AUSLI